MEFGGQEMADGGTTKFTFEDRYVKYKWFTISFTTVEEYTEQDYPNSVEIRVSSDIKQDRHFIKFIWSVGVVHFKGNQC